MPLSEPALEAPASVPRDRLARPLRDLRISVTDRCNFRCRYCMPREVFGETFRYLPHDQILTYEEVARLARIFRGLGVRKVRLTGGEPLLRRDLTELVRQLAAIDGLDLAMTTNGALLEAAAGELAAAGLRRVTVSLDSLDEATFQRMNDVDFRVAKVLAGLEAAREAGLAPIKINAVVRRGVNEASIVDLVERFRGTGMVVRFIEFMDVGTANGWRLDDVVPSREIVERIDRVYPLEPAEALYRGEVARRWRFLDGAGEIGVISSVSSPFCGDCTRARLSADGKLYTCLFASHGHDLRARLRSGAGDDRLETELRDLWQHRADRYSELRTAATAGTPRIEMSYIGG